MNEKTLDLCISSDIIISLLFSLRTATVSICFTLLKAENMDPFAYPGSDLDPESIQTARERSGEADLSDSDYLKKYGLALERDGKLMCCMEAILLFASENRPGYHPRSGIRIYTVDGTDRDCPPEQLHKRRFDGPFFSMLDDVFEYMPRVIRNSAKLYSLFFKEMPEYPEGAWREFIVNAVVHRDYGIQGAEIEIWIFDDRIEISSPGSLYNGITVESLVKRNNIHSSRNPKIADVFTACGLMSETGKGIRDAVKLMKKSYLNAPEFTEIETGLTIVMQNSPLFDVGDPAWESKVGNLDLNVNQKRILIVSKESSFTNSDYQQINNVDRDTAYREIQEIIDKGYISTKGKGRGLRYMPSLK